MTHPARHPAEDAYLHALLRRHAAVRLPLADEDAPAHALEALTQPLRLRRDPLAAEDLREAPDKDRDDGAPGLIVGDGPEALARTASGRMIVLGGPGSGKTTVLRGLLAAAARRRLEDPAAPLPIWVELPDLARSGAGLRDYVRALPARYGVEEALGAALWAAVESGGALLCLDSLDEAAPALRPALIGSLNALAPQHGGTWALGSRFSEYKGGQFARGSFAEWELLPLTDDGRRELARRVLPPLLRREGRPYRDEDAEAFIAALGRHQQAASWGASPLLFGMAAAVFAREGALPAARVALYGRLVAALLARRLPDAAQRAALQPALAALALELHRDKGRSFTRAELLELLPRLDPRIVEHGKPLELAHLLLGCGLFDVVDHERYRYQHQTFQEYLAATALAARLCSPDAATGAAAWDFAWGKRAFSRWTEVLRMMVGALVLDYGPAGAAAGLRWLSALLAQQHAPAGDPGGLGFALAIRSLAEVGAPPASWPASTELADLLRDWARQTLAATRGDNKQAAARLKELSAEVGRLHLPVAAGAVEVLVAGAGDSNDRVRRFALDLLHDLGDLAPIEPFVAALRDREEAIRQKAAYALAQRAERAPLEPLLAALRDKGMWVGRSAADALRKQGERVPLDRLLALAEDPSGDIRAAAVTILGERAPLELLVACLGDAHWKTRSAAARSLAARGPSVARPEVLAPLRELGLSRHAATRQEALKALVAICGPAHDDVLIPVLLANCADDSSSSRQEVAGWLAALGERAPVAELLGLVERGPAPERGTAVAALKALGWRLPVPALEALLRHKEAVVRAAALTLLGACGERAPLDPLLAALADRKPEVRVAAARALSSLGERAPVAAIVALLGDKQITVRTAAAEALLPHGERVPAEALIEALPRVDWYEEVLPNMIGELARRRAEVPLATALKVLRQTDNAEGQNELAAAAHIFSAMAAVIPPAALLELIQSKKAAERSCAAAVLNAALEEGALHELVEPLTALLEHPRAGVREAAGWALGDVAVKRTPAWVEAQAEAEQAIALAQVRAAAAQVLGGLAAEAPRDLLRSALRDPVPGVRAAAAAALGATGAPEAQAELLDALSDPHANVREAAAVALGRLGAPLPAERAIALLRAMPTQGLASDRVELAAALRRTRTPVPAEALIELLHDDRDEVRTAARDMLIALGDAAPEERLIAILRRGGTDGFTRYQFERASVAAAQVLAARGKQAPLAVLLDMMVAGRSQISPPVGQVLAGLGALVPLEPLLEGLAHDRWAVRKAALNALAGQGERAPIAPIVAALGDGDSFGWEVRRAAVWALGAHAGRAPVEPLAEILRAPSVNEWEDDQMRAAAAEALARFGERAPVALLAHTLRGDRGRWVREACARALGTLGERAPVAYLVTALGDAHDDVREAAAEALVRLGARVPTETLLSALPAAPGPVLAALAARDEPAALHAVVEATRHGDWRVQRAAAAALDIAGPRVPLDTLLGLLGDLSGELRAAAVGLLARHHPAMLGELRAEAEAILRGGEPGAVIGAGMWTRFAVTVARLGQATPRLLDALTPLLDSPLPQTRAAAAHALGVVRRAIPDAAIRRLVALRHDPDSEAVRSAAEKALVAILTLETAIEDD